MQSSKRARMAIFLTVFVDLLGFGIVIPILPLYAQAIADHPSPWMASVNHFLGLGGIGTTPGAFWAGVGFLSYSVMQFIASPILGRISDKAGRKPVLWMSLVGSALGYLMLALTSRFEWMLAARILDGITGGNISVAQAAMADTSEPEERSKVLGMIGAAFGLGFVIGPAIGGLLGHLGPRAPFFAAAALALLNCASGIFLLPESLPRERRRAFSFARAHPFGTFKSLARHRGTLVLFAAWFPWMLAHQSYPSVWAFFTRIKFGWSVAAIGASLSYVGLVLASAQAFVTRRLVPAIGERRAIFVGLSSGFVGFVGNAIVPQGWMIYPVMTFAGLQGLVFPSMNSTLSKTVAPNEQGELQGAVSSLVSLSAIIGPPLMTNSLALFTRPGAEFQFPGAPFLLAGALTLTALLIVKFGAREIFVSRAS